VPLIALLLALLGITYGGRRLGRAVRNVARTLRPADGGPAMSPRQARDILGVPENAPPAAVEAAYRRLMLRAHPDQGGTAGLAAQLNAARAVLRG
jgi:DnaJ-domain-containing protein 1